MFLNKAPVALCGASHLPPGVWLVLLPTSSRPSCFPPRRRGLEPGAFAPRTAHRTRRPYATVSGDTPKHPESSITHHDWPKEPHPTPYQIFDQKQSSPYSKARFYALVKLYHPDRHTQASPALSHAVRIERYRLVVTANEILSDPAKRRAYDLYGSGWGVKASMDNSMYRNAEKSWRAEPGNASMNATWEDWERWYGERDGKQQKQQTVFMSNEMFVVVLCAFVVAGSMGQARRASQSTLEVVEMREKKSEAISQGVNMRKAQQVGMNRHERIESFLRQREDWKVAAQTPPPGPPEK